MRVTSERARETMTEDSQAVALTVVRAFGHGETKYTKIWRIVLSPDRQQQT